MGNWSPDKQWFQASWSFTSFSRKYVFLAYAHTHIFVAVPLFRLQVVVGWPNMDAACQHVAGFNYDYYFLTSSIKLNSLDNKNGNYIFNFHQQKISIDSRMAFWRDFCKYSMPKSVQSIGLLLITQHNYFVRIKRRTHADELMRWLYSWYRYRATSCYRLRNVVRRSAADRAKMINT